MSGRQNFAKLKRTGTKDGSVASLANGRDTRGLRTLTTATVATLHSDLHVMMGLDLSLTGTGLCVVSSNRVRHLHLKTLPLHDLPKRADTQIYNGKFYGTDEERIAYIALTIMEEWRDAQPDLVLIEGYSYGSKGRALSGLHELGGVVKHHLWAVNALWIPIAPTTNKTYSTGNHRADKNQMLARARMMWPACPNHDVADAFLLARYGLRKYDELVESVMHEEAA